MSSTRISAQSLKHMHHSRRIFGILCIVEGRSDDDILTDIPKTHLWRNCERGQRTKDRKKWRVRVSGYTQSGWGREPQCHSVPSDTFCLLYQNRNLVAPFHHAVDVCIENFDRYFVLFYSFVIFWSSLRVWEPADAPKEYSNEFELIKCCQFKIKNNRNNMHKLTKNCQLFINFENMSIVLAQ